MFYEDPEIPSFTPGEPGTVQLDKLNKLAAAVKDVHAQAAARGDDTARLAGLDAAVADLRTLRAEVEAMRAVQPLDVGGSERELSCYVRGTTPNDAPILRAEYDDGRPIQRSANEQKVNAGLRLFGEQTRHMGWVPGLLDDHAPKCEWQHDLQRSYEELCIVELATGKRANQARARLAAVVDRAPREIKRIFGDSSGIGTEWIPAEIVMPMLDKELLLESQRRVAGLFGTTPMSSKVVSCPFLSTGLRPYLKGTTTSDDPAPYTSSTATTAERSRTAVGWAVRTQVDDDASEDAVIDSMAILRESIVDALIDGEEDAIINGDTAGTHQDTIASWDIRSRWGSTGLGTSADHRRAWIGLRARGFDVSGAAISGNSAQTYAGYLTARGTLSAPHGTAGRLAVLTSDEYYIKKILGFSEVVTLEKYGPGATILSGEVGRLGQAPVVVTQFISADMETSGLFTGGGGALSGYVVVNTDRFKIGVRRGPVVELFRDPRRGTRDIVATARKVFYTLDGSSTKNLIYVYNVG